MNRERIPPTDDWLAKAGVLADALPYMREHAGETVVVKYGGHAMGDDSVAQNFARDIVLLKQVGINPIVVHGGGPQIGAMLERLKIKSSFIDGLRVTDADTVDIVEMVLCGSINKQIVTAINRAGGFAVGMSGKDGNLIRAQKLRRTKRDPGSNIEKILDLGYVGEPTEINPHILDTGETYNINADTAAGAVAAAVGAVRLLMLTDVAGVLDDTGRLIKEMTVERAKTLMQTGTITDGMIPKVQTCLDAVAQGVEAAVIMDGRVAHAVLLELFTPTGAGTLIKAK